MKKFFQLISAIFLITLIFTGCGDDHSEKKKVAISFAHSSEIWERYGKTLQDAMSVGNLYDVDFHFANSVDEQIQQIEKFVQDEPDCIIIGAVDRTRLASALEKVKEKNIPVIAYDRLILDTDAVSYYVTFDNEAVGEAMGNSIEYFLFGSGVAQPTSTYNVEVFSGDPTDKNAEQYFNGAMKVLNRYFQSGVFVCRSGEMDFKTVSMADWNAQNVTTRMRRIMQTYYANGEPLNIVLCPNDAAADAVRNVLREVNYSGPFPILTGQDAEQMALTAIQNGTQMFTIYKPPQDLANKTVRMVKAVTDGIQPEINDNKTNNNGKITVPAYLCTPVIIDRDHINIVQ